MAKEATTVLRKAGFRYSRVMQHWEGLARFEDASTLAKTYSGSARRVGLPGAADAAAAE